MVRAPKRGKTGFSAALALAAVVAAPSQAGAAGFHKYVALGDSYTAVGDLFESGGGPLGCARSSVNYPHDLAAALGVGLSDASCTAAVTADMTAPQSTLGGSNPPQFDSLTPDTDLVTVGIGGNDFGFVDVITTCGELSVSNTFSNPCQQHFTSGGTDQLVARIDALAPRIAGVLQGIHQRSPHATVVLVGYLPVLPPAWGCWPSVPVAIGDVPWLHGIERKLNDMLAREAAANGALNVDPNRVSGRDACQWPWNRWVEPLVPAAPTLPIHPNATGQRAVAAMIETRLGS
jgi:lysophospholipase L1-like esterase